jgi:hypothetical protein
LCMAVWIDQIGLVFTSNGESPRDRHVFYFVWLSVLI